MMSAEEVSDKSLKINLTPQALQLSAGGGAGLHPRKPSALSLN